MDAGDAILSPGPCLFVHSLCPPKNPGLGWACPCPLGAPAPRTAGGWGRAQSPGSCWRCCGGGLLVMSPVLRPMENYPRWDVAGTPLLLPQGFPWPWRWGFILFLLSQPYLGGPGGLRLGDQPLSPPFSLLLLGRHRETEARCCTQRYAGILRGINSPSLIPCGGCRLLWDTASLGTQHPLGTQHSFGTQHPLGRGFPLGHGILWDRASLWDTLSLGTH